MTGSHGENEITWLDDRQNRERTRDSTKHMKTFVMSILTALFGILLVSFRLLSRSCQATGAAIQDAYSWSRIFAIGRGLRLSTVLISRIITWPFRFTGSISRAILGAKIWWICRKYSERVIAWIAHRPIANVFSVARYMIEITLWQVRAICSRFSICRHAVIVVISTCFLFSSTNFSFKTHAGPLSDMKEAMYWIDKIIEIIAEQTAEGLLEYNRLRDDISNYKLDIKCQGGENFKRYFKFSQKGYSKDSTLKIGQKIDIEVSNPERIGHFEIAEGTEKTYNSESGEWESRPIPKGLWENYLGYVNYAYTREVHHVKVKFVYHCGEDEYFPYGPDGISDWTYKGFYTVYHGTNLQRPTDEYIYNDIIQSMRSRGVIWGDPEGEDSYLDVAEVELAGKHVETKWEDYCDPTVIVFTRNVLTRSGAANVAVKTELISDRDYVVRHKCEIGRIQLNSDGSFTFGDHVAEYVHKDVPTGGTDLRKYELTTGLGNECYYSVRPDIVGTAVRWLVPTKHANCPHQCAVHDSYSTVPEITNPTCVVYSYSSYVDHHQIAPYIFVEERNCVVHGDGDKGRICARNRYSGIGVRQRLDYPIKEDENP